jgi:hypothetical protein
MNSGGINEKKTHTNGNKSQTIGNFFSFFIFPLKNRLIFEKKNLIVI